MGKGQIWLRKNGINLLFTIQTQDSGFSNVTLNPCSPIGYSYTLTGSYLWKAPCSKGPTAMDGMTDETMDTDVFRLNGTGNPAKCYNVTKTLFNSEAKCDVPPCSFNGVHSPIPVGSFKVCSRLSRFQLSSSMFYVFVC